MPAPHMMGIYPPESIQEVAQSLPLDPLGPGAADLLAGDVEYRLHFLLQEAKKFMVHGRRSTLTPEDVEYAMEALNVEPVLVPPRPLPQAPFHAVPVSAGQNPSQQLYHEVDDEIDFATYLRDPLPAALGNSAGVKWKAHWLAVEGVQPAIPENPPPSSRAGPSRTPAPTTGSAALRQNAKTHLTTELQLYFSRLTAALVPPVSSLPHLPGNPPPGAESHAFPDAERHRIAALASVRSDAAVAGVLAYLVRWVAESINKTLVGATGTIGCLIDVVEAILDNEVIFVEPYLHQFLGPLLSILLTVPLGPHPPSSNQTPTQSELRQRAANVLAKLVTLYGKSYPGLVPRLLSTFTRALQSSPFPSPLGAEFPPAGRYEGAVLGIGALGANTVRQALWGVKGEKLDVINNLVGVLYPGDNRKGKTGLMKATFGGLSLLVNPKPADSTPVAPSSDELAEYFGVNIAKALEKRPWMASELVRLHNEAEGEEGGESMDED
ncbi:histone H4-like TAF Taf6, SAGA complex subunit [Vanrija albida]|uniref:Histone H4-like TAF Taf6, SAGA complex subunit n=1 Tax=Vanrija albida TaxID=181172 RepID=A0ABR3PYV8_9TREE